MLLLFYPFINWEPVSVNTPFGGSMVPQIGLHVLFSYDFVKLELKQSEKDKLTHFIGQETSILKYSKANVGILAGPYNKKLDPLPLSKKILDFVNSCLNTIFG